MTLTESICDTDWHYLWHWLTLSVTLTDCICDTDWLYLWHWLTVSVTLTDYICDTDWHYLWHLLTVSVTLTDCICDTDTDCHKGSDFYCDSTSDSNSHCKCGSDTVMLTCKCWRQLRVSAKYKYMCLQGLRLGRQKKGSQFILKFQILNVSRPTCLCVIHFSISTSLYVPPSTRYLWSKSCHPSPSWQSYTPPSKDTGNLYLSNLLLYLDSENMSFFGALVTLSAGRTTVIFIILLLVLLLFKSGLHILEVVSDRNGFRELLENLYREFMIMGLVSFGRYQNAFLSIIT
jgi:hypothetical protein